MKSKKSLYILVPLVAIVWGLIIWKVLSYSSSADVISTGGRIEISELEKDSTEYVLHLSYHDPFLRGAKTSTKIEQTDKKKEAVSGLSEKRIKALFSETKKPEIKYSGMIEQGKRRTALVLYKNEQHLWRQGQKHGEIQVGEIFPDSLIILANEEIYSYKRIREN